MERKKQWAEYIRECREKSSLSRKALALAAGCDNSYITLIERDGYVPRRGLVVSLAMVAGANVDKALLLAGYAPTAACLEKIHVHV